MVEILATVALYDGHSISKTFKISHTFLILTFIPPVTLWHGWHTGNIFLSPYHSVLLRLTYWQSL